MVAPRRRAQPRETYPGDAVVDGQPSTPTPRTVARALIGQRDASNHLPVFVYGEEVAVHRCEPRSPLVNDAVVDTFPS